MDKNTITKLIIILLIFLSLEFVLANLVESRNDTINIYWWMLTGEIMGGEGFFNVWTAYPPVFPALFHGAYSLLRGYPERVILLWKIFNLILISSSAILIYLIINKIHNKTSALVSAIGFFLINMSWNSAILVGIKSDQFDYFPIFLLLFSLYFLLKKKILLSSLFCAIGTLTKLFPVIILVLAFFNLKRKNRIKYVSIFLITCFLIILPFLIINPNIFFSGFIWNLGRDSWETIWTYPDIKFAEIQSHEPMIFPVTLEKTGNSSLTFVMATAFLLIVYFIRNKLHNKDNVIKTALILLLLILIFSKGISSYFILWLFPLIIISYKDIYGFIIVSILLLVGNIEHISNTYYWLSIFLRHAIFIGLFLHQIFLMSRNHEIRQVNTDPNFISL